MTTEWTSTIGSPNDHQWNGKCRRVLRTRRDAEAELHHRRPPSEVDNQITERPPMEREVSTCSPNASQRGSGASPPTTTEWTSTIRSPNDHQRNRMCRRVLRTRRNPEVELHHRRPRSGRRLSDHRTTTNGTGSVDVFSERVATRKRSFSFTTDDHGVDVDYRITERPPAERRKCRRALRNRWPLENLCIFEFSLRDSRRSLASRGEQGNRTQKYLSTRTRP